MTKKTYQTKELKKGWRLVSLGEVAKLNPSETLKTGVMAKKIGMDAIIPFTKKIPSFRIESFNGGSKFKNGDTLVAKLVQCLENGKNIIR